MLDFFTCSVCNKQTNKHIRYINRARKKGYSLYCGKKCSISGVTSGQVRNTETLRAGFDSKDLWKKTLTIWTKEKIFSNTIPEPNSGCWIWDGTLGSGGYGVTIVCISARKMSLRAHRISYAAFNNVEIDNGLVCHKCDNPSCVNPDHLFLGTHLDNMRDMKKKGRSAWDKSEEYREIRREIGRRIPRDKRARGEQCNLSTLTVAKVVAMQVDAEKNMNFTKLGEKYGCTPGHVWKIISRRAWKHVP